MGGDHLIYLDFKKRYDLKARISSAEAAGHHHIAEKLRLCRSRAGVVVADVSGHFMTDSLVALMLHQAFLLGAVYELDLHGEITTRLFENLNKRFYQSFAVNKFLTLLYGEINQDGAFRFITAGHPFPVVFSRSYDRIVGISDESLSTFPPIGTMPSSHDIDLEAGEATPLSIQGAPHDERDQLDGTRRYPGSPHGRTLGTSKRRDWSIFPARLEACFRKGKDHRLYRNCDSI